MISKADMAQVLLEFSQVGTQALSAGTTGGRRVGDYRRDLQEIHDKLDAIFDFYVSKYDIGRTEWEQTDRMAVFKRGRSSDEDD